MLRKTATLLVVMLATAIGALAQQGTGSIKGKVLDKDQNNEPLPFVQVVVKQNGTYKAGVTTDIDGKFIVPSLSPGAYDLEVAFSGYTTKRIEGIVVKSDQLTPIDDILMTAATKDEDGKDLEAVEVVHYKVPLIDKDGGASGATVTREDIARMPGRSATAVASTVGGVYSAEGSSALSIRGSRSDATYYYIDGIKVRGSTALPKSAIEEVTVITGGVPANYGDLTGGIISVTTRGPSARWFGSAEGVTSGFRFRGKSPLGYDDKVIGLDSYGYNLLEGMVAGPIWLKEDEKGRKKPIMGFFLSGNYTDQVDGRPLFGGNWRIREDVRDSLLDPSLQGPLRPSGLGVGAYYNTDYLYSDAFEKVKWRMNSRSQSASAAGKIDINAGPNVNITFGGSAAWFKNMGYNYTGSLMNFDNYAENSGFDYRVYGKLTHRFQKKKGSKSKVSSAYYSLMADYTKTYRKTQDARHKDNLFNYGRVGEFATTKINTYEYTADGDSLIHNGWQDTRVDYTPSEDNSALAAITTQYYDIYADDPNGNWNNLNQLVAGNALRNGDVPQSVYSIWNNMGTPYNGYSKSETDQFRLTGMGSLIIGDHSLTLGFEFEQRVDRAYSVAPRGFWTIGRQYANSHITELDRNNATYDFYGTYPRVTYGRLNAAPGDFSGDDAQFFFDYNLRDALGYDTDGTDWIDFDAIDPSIMNVGMFSPDELFNQGSSLVSYYGYDHAGNKVKHSTDIEDFYEGKDDVYGNYTRNIGAFQPTYIAGYLMDKFAFEDLIFNVGVRVDYFDANQPVLKDPLLLYPTNTAGETREEFIHPTNIDDDFVVYVNDVENPSSVNGYRDPDGNVWYDANGVEVGDPELLSGPKGIAPYLKDPSLTSPDKDAFEDYKPQINIMPRIAFSFPISDQALFFAHYDVLTRRPSTGLRFNPVDYLYLGSINTILNNPNLRPEKTIDYEVGFQQALGARSSIKIAAFYREQRDQIQLMNMFGAYPSDYRTYGNQDFGTVKGLTVSYDLRRTGNIRLTASYTLQFAEGTGSNANSAINLVNSGQPNLRVIFPYTYDQRHGIALTMDYRYGEGKDYNGPMIGDFELLANTGLNIVSNIGSGTPYSAQQNQTGEALIGGGTSSGLDGTLNGSRLPWTYRVDAQLDRTIPIQLNKKDENARARFGYLNVYLRVSNLLNTRNVYGVYRGTGNPDDDGYLAAAEFQTAIQNQLDEQSYRNYYQMKVANPWNLGVPRTIRLGVKFDF